MESDTQYFPLFPPVSCLHSLVVAQMTAISISSGLIPESSKLFFALVGDDEVMGRRDVFLVLLIKWCASSKLSSDDEHEELAEPLVVSIALGTEEKECVVELPLTLPIFLPSFI
mmetsp:Transcript_33101/g.42558  ORF Transcript_33101/g.42558 Transcript_33101/m.42558 type:complete len:114 (+) Transcript_33101:139-480(+)